MIDHTWYSRPPGITEHVSAGGVVVRAAGKKLMVALVREKPGHLFILPKGHVEAGELLEEAARREITEEAGLDRLKLLALLGVCERLDYNKKSWKQTHYFLFITDQVEGIPTDPQQDYLVDWFPLDDLPAMFWPEQRDLIKKNFTRIIKRVFAEAELNDNIPK